VAYTPIILYLPFDKYR